MPATASRSASQQKISDSFRSTSKSSKPLKQTKAAPPRKTPSPVPPPHDPAPPSLETGPNLISAARKIESKRKAPFVHPENQSMIEIILRDFDLSPKYGPCVGISRLDRFMRAEKMGLNPPREVLAILESKEGKPEWNVDLFSQKSAV